MKAAVVKFVEPDRRIVSSTESVSVPLLQDPRFVIETLKPDTQINNSAYVIIARFNFSEPEILLKCIGIDEEGNSLLELPGGPIANAEDAFLEVSRIVKGQVGSEITELQKFGSALQIQENSNLAIINSAQLYLAEANPKSCGGEFQYGSLGLTWVGRSELRRSKVVELTRDLDPSKAGRMGIMILAGLDYVNGLMSPK